MRKHDKYTIDSSGLGLLDVVQIVLIILKIAKLIDLSWWIVLSPLWFMLVVICVLAIAMITEYHKSKEDGAG